jgi:hypothetical protein
VIENVQVELFRAFLIRCPHCDGEVPFRMSLDGPHAGNYFPAHCSCCKQTVTRMEFIRERIRHQAVEGVSFDCMCGRSSFFVGQAGACSFCGESL